MTALFRYPARPVPMPRSTYARWMRGFGPDGRTIASTWAIEPKLDGIRVLVYGGAVPRLFTRTGVQIDTTRPTRRLARVIDRLVGLHLTDGDILDGELMGLSSRAAPADTEDNDPDRPLGWPFLWLFDWPHARQAHAPEAPYDVRRAALASLLTRISDDGFLAQVPDVSDHADPIAVALRYPRGEGVVLKRRDQPYPWARSEDDETVWWRKVRVGGAT